MAFKKILILLMVIYNLLNQKTQTWTKSQLLLTEFVFPWNSFHMNFSSQDYSHFLANILTSFFCSYNSFAVFRTILNIWKYLRCFSGEQNPKFGRYLKSPQHTFQVIGVCLCLNNTSLILIRQPIHSTFEVL